MGAISSPKYSHVIIKKRLKSYEFKFNKLNLHKIFNTNENHNINFKQCIRYACHADKRRYRHDRREDKRGYQHDCRADSQCHHKSDKIFRENSANSILSRQIHIFSSPEPKAHR